jgi:hypothetical protein
VGARADSAIVPEGAARSAEGSAMTRTMPGVRTVSRPPGDGRAAHGAAYAERPADPPPYLSPRDREIELRSLRGEAVAMFVERKLRRLTRRTSTTARNFDANAAEPVCTCGLGPHRDAKCCSGRCDRGACFGAAVPFTP